MTYSIRPLSDHFGVEITGFDLAAGEFTQQTHDLILDLWRRRLLLVFRGQKLEPERLLRIAGSFGELDLAPPFDNERSDLDGYPQIAVVSNLRRNGVPLGGLGTGELSWHSDMTYRASPPPGCVLTAVEVPPHGGDTHFLNMHAALKALPETLRARLAGLRLIHDAQYTSAGTPRQKGDSFARVDHPMVTRDPLSGQEILFLGRRRQSEVVGSGTAEGEALLNEVWQRIDQTDLTLTHHWQPGDVLFWANMAVMHRRDAFDPEARRLLLRAQVSELDA